MYYNNTNSLFTIVAINVIHKLRVHTKYTCKDNKTFSVLNDCPSIAKKLPRVFSNDILMSFRSAGSTTKKYFYRPLVVRTAFEFLQQSNYLYKDISFNSDFIVPSNNDNNGETEVDYTLLDDEEDDQPEGNTC